MASLFSDEEPIDVGAQILRHAFQPPSKRIFRDRTDPLTFSDEYLQGYSQIHKARYCVPGQFAGASNPQNDLMQEGHYHSSVGACDPPLLGIRDLLTYSG